MLAMIYVPRQTEQRPARGARRIVRWNRTFDESHEARPEKSESSCLGLHRRLRPRKPTPIRRSTVEKHAWSSPLQLFYSRVGDFCVDKVESPKLGEPPQVKQPLISNLSGVSRTQERLFSRDRCSSPGSETFEPPRSM